MSRRILITGAAGRIGSYLTRLWADTYDLVLTDIRQPETTLGFPFTEANLTDEESMCTLCEGVDTVIHLGADPRPQAPWESLLPNNVIGLYNVYEAASQARCRRVVFASSVNAILGYPEDSQPHTHMPPRPGNLYGATKVWGEAVASFYADFRDLSSVCLRFGAVTSPEFEEKIHIEHKMISMVLTYRDLGKLVTASVEAPDDLRYGVFHGVSNNRFKWIDISDARRLLGYEPEDDSFVIAEKNRLKQTQ